MCGQQEVKNSSSSCSKVARKLGVFNKKMGFIPLKHLETLAMWIGKLLIVAANQPSKVGIRSYTLFSDKRKFKLMSSHVTQQFKEPILLTWNLLTWNLPPLFGESWGWHSWTPRPTLDKANDWSLISSPYGTIHLDHLGLFKKHDCLKKNTRTQFQIYICMSAIPGMYLICHQIHWKNLLGPNPTCNSTGSKVTFGKRTSAELAVHARSIFPTQPRMPRCIVCHRPPATSPVPQRCQWGLPFCKCYDAKLLWPLKSDHSQ